MDEDSITLKKDDLDRILRIGQIMGFAKGLEMWPMMYAVHTEYINTPNGRIQTDRGKKAQQEVFDALERLRDD